MIDPIPWWLKLMAATGQTLFLALIVVTIVTAWKVIKRLWQKE